MNIQRLFWRRQGLRDPFSICGKRSYSQGHGMLRVPNLISTDETKLHENGIPGLYSPAGFKIAWTDWQKFSLDELGKRIANERYDNSGVKFIQNQIFKYARDPEKAAIFNHASMAYNNHFYFKGINYDDEQTTIPSSLEAKLDSDFHSVSNLKAEFLANAKAMYGPGFVWLVHVTPPNTIQHLRKFSILRTYLAGSPLAGAHDRLQDRDMNTQNARSMAEQSPGAFGNLKTRKGSYVGVSVTPLLCVNTWEHAWMVDWGVTGKEAFLEAWWDKINWNVVDALAAIPDSLTSTAYQQGGRSNRTRQVLHS